MSRRAKFGARSGKARDAPRVPRRACDAGARPRTAGKRVDGRGRQGYSMAVGARGLKRTIDDRIKLPLSLRWKEANSFRVTVSDDQISLEVAGPRLVVSADSNAIAV